MKTTTNKNNKIQAGTGPFHPSSTATGAYLREPIKNTNTCPRNEKRNETERTISKPSKQANHTGTKNGTISTTPTVPRNAPLGAYRNMERTGTKTTKKTPTQPITGPITLIIPGNIRSKKNSREKHYSKTKTGKLVQFSAASEAYRAWEQRAQQAARAQLRQYGITNPTDQPLQLTVIAHMTGNLLDLDAAHTSVMDALEGIAWVKDKQIKRFSDASMVEKSKGAPWTEITYRRV